MSTSTPSLPTMPTAGRKATLITKPSKPSKPSKKIILRLPSTVLAWFPSAQPPRKESRSKTSTSSSSTTSNVKIGLTPQDNESESTPTAAIELSADDNIPAPASNGLKRKGGPGSKPDNAKRPALGAEVNETSKSKAKPGPKRRIAERDTVTKGSFTGPTPISNHKLGPKANQGAINAGLRALDRTGKPCRRWQRKGFQLKSFTGHAWTLPSWHTSKVKENGYSGDVKSDTTNSSDIKNDIPSSVIGSEKSNSAARANPLVGPTDITSSPAEPLAVQAPTNVPILT